MTNKAMFTVVVSAVVVLSFACAVFIEMLKDKPQKLEKKIDKKAQLSAEKSEIEKGNSVLQNQNNLKKKAKIKLVGGRPLPVDKGEAKTWERKIVYPPPNEKGEPRTNAKGRPETWTSLCVCNYTMNDTTSGSLPQYEFLIRNTRTCKFDGSEVIGIVKRKEIEDCVIINVIYRPAVNRCILEFPGGLIDDKESPEVAALRELKEETGFTGKVISTSKEAQLFPSPWLTNENVLISVIEIDGDTPENINPKCSHEREEFISVLLVPLSNLEHSLNDLIYKHGFGIDTKLYMYAKALSSVQMNIVNI